MVGKSRRHLRKFKNTLVAFTVLSVCFFLLGENLQELKTSLSFTKLPKLTFTQEQKKVLEDTKPVTPQIVLQKSAAVLAASGSGSCGKAWTWPCDDSKKAGAYVNGKLLQSAGNTIYFENVLFKKEPPGLEIGAGVSTSETITNNNGTPDDPRDDTKQKFGLCLANSGTFESLAMVSLSQPLLPKTIQGNELSIRPVDKEEHEYAKINLEWLSKLTPEKFEALFCSMEKTAAEYVLRTMDTYGMLASSNMQGADFASFLMYKCQGRSPGETGSKFTEDWKKDLNRDTTTFKVLIENNEFHNEVEEKFRDNMLDDGFSGIINPGAGYIGALAFQPKSKDTYLAKLSGSAISSQNLTNALTAPPQKTTTDLTKNKDAIDSKAPDKDSSTLLSTSGTAYQDEYERATMESAIFGGVYYIPTSEIAKGGNPSMLSWDPAKLDPSKYLCNEKSSSSSCPIIRATSGCSGIFQAKVSIRLRQIILSAVNDTDSYAGTTGGGASEEGVTTTTASNTELARSYTRAGDFFQGQFRTPQASIKRATLDELIVTTGKGTAACLTYAAQRVAAQSETQLTEKDIERIKDAAKSPNYDMQQILVSPINVKYRTWALYKRNPAILAVLKSLGLGRVFGKDPEWAADEVTGEKIRPALISFKVDSLFRGQDGTLPASDDSKDVEENINAYLAKQKIMPLSDARIDCMTGPYGTPEYWLCSDSETILPKCQ